MSKAAPVRPSRSLTGAAFNTLTGEAPTEWKQLFLHFSFLCDCFVVGQNKRNIWFCGFCGALACMHHWARSASGVHTTGVACVDYPLAWDSRSQKSWACLPISQCGRCCELMNLSLLTDGLTKLPRFWAKNNLALRKPWKLPKEWQVWLKGQGVGKRSARICGRLWNLLGVQSLDGQRSSTWCLDRLDKTDRLWGHTGGLFSFFFLFFFFFFSRVNQTQFEVKSLKWEISFSFNNPKPAIAGL